MKTLLKLVVAMVLGVAGVATAASETNEYIGLSRILTAANQWSPASAPTSGSNIRDWLIGGAGFQIFTSGTDLVVNAPSGTNRAYVDTVFIESGINSLTNDLGFNVTASADNRIVVSNGFAIASGVTNNVVLKSTKWVSSNANNVITFNHNGSGTLKIQNDWVETPGIALVYKGSATNKVEFGTLASTYTGGTTLDNVSASLTAATSIGAASGNVILTNGSKLSLSTYTLTNNIIAAAGSDVKTVFSSSAKTRTIAITAQGYMVLMNSNTNTLQWNGAVTIDSAARLDVENAGSGVSQLGGTLSGSGLLRTSDTGTTVLNTALDTSGFSGDVVSRGTTQHKRDNSFGAGGTVYLNGANLRGIPSASDLDIAFTNKITVQSDSRMALTTGGGLTGTNTSVTAGGDIAFTSSSTLSLEAGGNADNYAAANTLNINGAIKETASNIGNVLVDNHWTTAYYTNSITKLSASNTYHGKTDIQFGRFQLVNDGSINNSSNINVQAQGIFDVSSRTGGAYTYGGTVSGTGLIVGDVTLNGNVNPGTTNTTLGTLNFADALTLGSTATTTVQVVSNDVFDVLNGDGGNVLTAQSGAAFVFDFTGNTTVSNGSTFAVLQNWSSIVTNGASFSTVGLDTNLSLDVSALASGGILAVSFASPSEQYTTNGTPYSWLDQYGLTNYVADDVLDQDTDGLMTWQEYIVDTDPTNKTSCFKVAQAIRNTVTWSPVSSGRVYSVYWSTNLVKGFTNLQDNITFPQSSYTNTAPDAKVNHYQVKVRLE